MSAKYPTFFARRILQILILISEKSRGLRWHSEGWHLEMTKTTPTSEIRNFIELIKQNQNQTSLIRIGAEGDGGYLLPDCLDGIDSCFSPGVGDSFSFEEDLSQRGIQCFLADGTISSTNLNFPHHNNMHFTNKNLGWRSDNFVMTFDEWLKASPTPTGDKILQMDIEGSEWGVLTLLDRRVLNLFRIVVIEFHEMDKLWDDAMFSSRAAVFAKLLKDFKIVHIHVNNSSGPFVHEGIDIAPVMEFTFLRNDYCEANRKGLNFPHPLDYPNLPDKPQWTLSKIWVND